MYIYIYIYIYIYMYILAEYFVLNIYTKWMLQTKQKIYWLIIKKQTEKTLIIPLKKGFFKSFSEQNNVDSSILDKWIDNDIKRWIYI